MSQKLPRSTGFKMSWEETFQWLVTLDSQRHFANKHLERTAALLCSSTCQQGQGTFELVT